MLNDDSKRTENIYSDSHEPPATNTNSYGFSAASPTSTFSKIQTMTKHSPVRLHQAMFSPPKPLGLTQRERH